MGEEKENSLFDKDELARNEESIAKSVLHNANAVAEFFNVSVRTVQNWMDGGMSNFCTPATPGKNDGNFPVKKIIEWRKTLAGDFSFDKDKEKDEEIRRLKVESEQLKFKERQFEYRKKIGGMVDLDEVIRWSSQSAAQQKSMLYELLPKLNAIKPSGVPQNLWDEFMQSAERLVDKICLSVGKELVELGQQLDDAELFAK